MKRLSLFGLAGAIALSLAACGTTGGNDPAAALRNFTLADVQQAQSIYVANPSVPTAPAALECLSWGVETLQAAPAGITLGATLETPKGIASSVADLDVALNTASGAVPPILLSFNQNCGGYIEDLKAEAAAHAGSFGVNLFGLVKF
jgi:hypothetical protein